MKIKVNELNKDYSNNLVTKRSRRFLIYLASIFSLLILVCFIQGLIIKPLGDLTNVSKDLISNNVSIRNTLYHEAISSSLLEYKEESNNKVLLDVDEVIYKEIRRELKTYIVNNNIDVRGELVSNYREFNDLSEEENINYYLFTYRPINLKINDIQNKEFINSLFNKYLSKYYKNNYLDKSYFEYQDDVALSLIKYVFEEDYSSKYKELYDEYLSNYTLFYNELIKDFESNNIIYKDNLIKLNENTNKYSLLLLVEIFISYFISFLLLELLPRLIFKSDTNFTYKLFKVVGINKKTNKSKLKLYQYLISLVLSFIFNIYILFFVYLFFYSSFNLLNVSLFNISFLVIIIFTLLLSILNAIYSYFYKNKQTMINYLSKIIIKDKEEYNISTNNNGTSK